MLEFSILATILLFTSFLSLYLLYYMKDKTEDNIFYYFSFLIFFCFIDFISQGLECLFTPFYIKNIFGHLCIFGYTLIPVFWLFFVYAFTHQGKSLNKKIEYSLLIVPIFVLLALISDPWTHWFFNSITLSTSAYKLQLAYHYNWASYLGFYYNFAIGCVNLLISIYALIKGNKLYRNGYIALFIASLAPVCISPLNLTSIYPNFSFELISFVIALFLLTISIILYDSFDVMPIVNQNIIEDINTGLCFFNDKNILISVNPYCKLINISLEDINKNVNDLFKDRPEIVDFYNSPDSDTMELNIENKWYELKKKDIYNEDYYIGKVFTVNDITSRMWELEQKDMLVKEVHHRVKNNLQIILSLINLDLRYHPEDPLSVLNDTRSRLNYMSTLHEKLYTGNDLDEVDIKEYLPDIARSLLMMYESEIPVNVNMSSYMIGLDLAVSLGLILTEVVNNVVKYAFSDEEQGNFFIDFRVEDNQGVLDLYDDGVGLPDGFDFEFSNGLGMTVIKSLTAQIEGESKIIPDNGAHFKIKFPLN